MQSKVDGQKTWRDFALNFFGHRLSRAHGSFDHIVLAFDNYRVIPVFKSIEQAKRIKRGAPFPFHDGDALGDGPPDPAIWGSALQNRTYKTHVICVLVELLLDAYRPPRRGTSLTVDFVNSVRVAYHVDGSRTHGPLEQHSELGESDIKFMRYADACPRLEFVTADARQLPFADCSFDVYTIAFGLRNVTRIEEALSEAHRVLRPGGRFLCLEFSHLPNPLMQSVYDQYSFKIIPALGEVVASDRASYQYLVESIRKHPKQEDLAQMMRDAGMRAVSYTNLTFGVVAIHSGFRLPKVH